MYFGDMGSRISASLFLGIGGALNILEEGWEVDLSKERPKRSEAIDMSLPGSMHVEHQEGFRVKLHPIVLQFSQHYLGKGFLILLASGVPSSMVPRRWRFCTGY